MNLPCHLVIVKGTEFFDAKQGRYVDFPVTDVLQMMGRAGRPQFDETGVACIFVHEPKKNFYKKFLHEPFPVESSLHNQLHEHINAEIASGSLHNLNNCVEYLTWTYLFRRIVVNPSYYSLEDSSPKSVETYVVNLIKKVVKELVDCGCVDDIDGEYSSTYLGRIASYYYLHYQTVGLFRNSLQLINTKINSMNESTRIEELVKILCSALEFSELPVRHNEEMLNCELAYSLPWLITDTFESPHVKAVLLLQAHFYRKPLPISDYINDTKSVLDQVPRVLNSMIDIAAENGLLEVAFTLMKISQMIYQVT